VISQASSAGQIAAGFIVLMAFSLVLLLNVLQVGQVSVTRVTASNAVDGGALAGASWMASGQNEAAWVARKMWDSALMIEALYLVPFAPGPARQAYAEELWTSLLLHPAGGSCSQGAYSGCGPNGYFREVTNGVMEASWNIGRREMFTAVVNNLMGLVTFSDIRPTQEFLNVAPVSSYSVPLGPSSSFDLHYAGSPPPTVSMATRSATYYQYTEEPPGVREFPCPQAWGIRNTALPLPDIRAFVAWLRPLEVDWNGHKRYDIDLAQVIPSIHDLDVGWSDAACGMGEARTTPALALVPESILNGTGTTEVQLVYEIPRPNGGVLQSVSAAATAEYTTTPVPGAWEQPIRSAQAQVTSVR
jgi:hypothetical protein